MFSLSSALRHIGVGWLAAVALSAVTQASPMPEISPLEVRAASGDRLVFCHFMVSSWFSVNDI